MPLHIYKKASGDMNLERLKQSNTQSITAYGNRAWSVLGEVIVRVWRKRRTCLVRLLIVEGEQFHCILGRNACIELGCLEILDNDALHKPETHSGNVLSAQQVATETHLPHSDSPLSIEQLKQSYTSFLSGEVGQLDGKYHIKVNKLIQPVKHAQRPIAVASRERVKETLNEMSDKDIIEPVTKPTEWILSMVVVTKKSGQIRVCLDPKDLNDAIQREHYPLPVIEDVATRLAGAKLFKVLDVQQGFWHVELDDESSFLTTFNTPFGSYRFKRLPFGLSSSPEVFQRRMHEMIEGLHGCENMEMGIQDHDRNLLAFLNRCEQRNLHLNVDKIQLRVTEVPFIWHTATAN